MDWGGGGAEKGRLSDKVISACQVRNGGCIDLSDKIGWLERADFSIYFGSILSPKSFADRLTMRCKEGK